MELGRRKDQPGQKFLEKFLHHSLAESGITSRVMMHEGSLVVRVPLTPLRLPVSSASRMLPVASRRRHRLSLIPPAAAAISIIRLISTSSVYSRQEGGAGAARDWQSRATAEFKTRGNTAAFQQHGLVGCLWSACFSLLPLHLLRMPFLHAGLAARQPEETRRRAGSSQTEVDAVGKSDHMPPNTSAPLLHLSAHHREPTQNEVDMPNCLRR